MGNPFETGEEKPFLPPATLLVIFGATGDLTRRKLMPALYELGVDGYLPPNFIVIGSARSRLSDEEFRQRMCESARQSRRGFTSEFWNSFAENLFYEPVDGSEPADFYRLKNRIEALTRGRPVAFNHLYYMATAPRNFEDIARNLHEAGLLETSAGAAGRAALVIEKPFGRDLQSSRQLNQALGRHLRESQLYRIDHYLGKETVQNILALRFSNGIFEPLWNRNHVSSIQISVCESVGLEGRAEYFDRTGMLRDVVQNHVLQVLALICSEAPLSLNDADSIRDEKAKVLRAVKRMSVSDVSRKVVRAQYQAGYINGRPVAGYLEEEGVAPDSSTETYVTMQLEVDNWRWAGVPIFIRAGKRLPKRITEIAILFKKAPGFLFGSEVSPNVLAIQVQPDEGISLKVGAKPPGIRMRIHDVKMDFSYAPWFGKVSPDAYERLLLDAMNGDPALFARQDEIEEAWDLLQPVIAAWQSKEAPPVFGYEAGGWGPGEAAELLEAGGFRWRVL